MWKETLLGIDNIVLISILVANLTKAERKKVLLLSLSFVMILRISLLFMVGSYIKLNTPIMAPFVQIITIKDLILISLGIFFIYKGVIEIYKQTENKKRENENLAAKLNYLSIIAQIVIVDLIFSHDSMLMLFGLTNNKVIMIMVIMISVLYKLVFASIFGNLINKNPLIRTLVPWLIILTGIVLIGEGFHQNFGTVIVTPLYYLLIVVLIFDIIKMRLRKMKSEN